MDRRKTCHTTQPGIGLIMSTALVSIALTGCTTTAAPRADTSFGKAQVALERGEAGEAILHAEAAVLAEPRNPGIRALLGAAYLEAGRFQSAATSFEDALELGDDDPRTVLSFALANIAMGDNRTALNKLGEWEQAISPADLGLALALAGQAERGIHVLTNTLRNGENTAKVRQNLAYVYALAGNWRAARVMAAEDVPANQIDARLTEWAEMTKPEDFQRRVASLLQVNPANDVGQPLHLALANFPSQQAMIAEAAMQAPTESLVMAADQPNETETLAARVIRDEVQTIDPSATRIDAAATQAGPRFVSIPIVQELASRAQPGSSRIAENSSQRRMAATAASRSSAGQGSGTHLIQLGSYSSRADAELGWAAAKSKFPQLASHDVVITEAVVNGKTYFRVAADGFGKASALSLCSTVKSAGRGCFVYAAANPPAGAVDRGVRIAARDN